MKFAYARVSSTGQNLDRQLKAFEKYGIEERSIFQDKASGKNTDRLEYQLLKKALRPGDELYILSLDRLSRSKADIKKELEYFKDNKITIRILDIPTTLMEFPEGQEAIQELINNLLIEVLGTMAEVERQNIRKRQAEGIAVAKSKGKHLGRPKAVKPDNWEDVISEWKNKKITGREAQRQLNMKPGIFYKMLREENIQ